MRTTRRETIQGLAGAALLTQLAEPAAAIGPDDSAWTSLRATLGDRLIRVESPLIACAKAHGEGADALFAALRNPYRIGDDPGLTQTLGWVDAWTSRPSLYAVAAESTADVAAAIRFARKHRIQPVIRGGGHSYFGNSNAANSLLIWTRRMNDIRIEPAFRPQGAAHAKPVPAVSVGAGAIWGQVYKHVAVDHGLYVQGGGCLTVGVAGFVSGGGFGSFSKAFGTGAANLIEAEVVTADGQVRIANAHSEPELFFALKGGAGNSFGVITRLTLRTHPLPETMGLAQIDITATSDAAWATLVERMIAFYAETLFNPAWGEQIRFSPGRRLSIMMLSIGIGEAQIQANWKPFLDWLRAHPQDYAITGDPLIVALPMRHFWDPATLTKLPGVVLGDDRPGAPADNIFWASNRDEAGQVLNAYQSLWMPKALLAPDRRAALAATLIEAASHWSVTLHLNKGLAGGTPEALRMAADTATNPAVLDAFALLICAAEQPPAWPGIPGHEPDKALGRREAARVTQAMAPLRALVPGGGSYVSESDYFEKDWQRSHWGTHYPRLLAAKKRYDPTNLFRAHHTVGSRG